MGPESFYECESALRGYFTNSTSMELVNLCLIIGFLCSLGFVITSFVLASNTYAGFTAIFTGFVFLGYLSLSFWGFRYWKSRTMYGIIMGGGVFLAILSLQTAIFWGQYSQCSSIGYNKYVQCDHVAAMVSACVFAVLMLIILVTQLLVMFFRRDEILGSNPLDEGLGYSKVNSLASREESSSSAQHGKQGANVVRNEIKPQFIVEEEGDSIDL